MKTILLRGLQVGRKKLAVFCLVAAMFSLMFIGFFPSWAEDAQKLNELISAYPEALMKAFGVQGDIFSRLESFMAVEYYSMILPLMIVVYAVGLGANAIAGEIEDGTEDILLTQPVSRVKVYTAKYFTGLLQIGFFVIFSSAIVVLLAELFRVEYVFESYLYVGGISVLFAVAIYSIVYAISAFGSARGMVTSIAGIMFALMYAFDLIPKFDSTFENLRYVSLFYYFDYELALQDHMVNTTAVIVFLVVITIAFAAGLKRFTTRDITI
jgi:ABC-2 type transport system permease protein